MKTPKHTFASLNKEIELVRMYIDLQQLRFEQKIEYVEELELQNIERYGIPSMVLQPLIENSINRSVLNEEEKGKIELRLYSKEDYMECIIIDGRFEDSKVFMSPVTKKEVGSCITIISTYKRIGVLVDKGFKKSAFEMFNVLDSFGNIKGVKTVLVLPILVNKN